MRLPQDILNEPLALPANGRAPRVGAGGLPVGMATRLSVRDAALEAFSARHPALHPVRAIVVGRDAGRVFVAVVGNAPTPQGRRWEVIEVTSETLATRLLEGPEAEWFTRSPGPVGARTDAGVPWWLS